MCVKMKIQGKRGYRNSVPLKPPSHGLLDLIRKGAHILGQKEAVHQDLGDTMPFFFLPHPYVGVSRERHTTQLKGGLLC